MARYIDADKIKYRHGVNVGKNLGGLRAIALKHDIDNIHTEDVRPVVRAKWVDDHCSNCGCDVPAYIIDWKWQKDMDAKFCPQCGAYMREED